MGGRIARYLVTAAVLGGLAACAGTQIPKQQIASPGEALFNGQVRDEINCYRCHNGDGSGTLRGPNLAKRVPKLTDQEIATAIYEGPSLMPSFKGKINDAEIKEITAWLRTKFPK
jgi:mono/diheme cytochrome c family protein